jgi:hypothetical protein
MRKGYSGVSGVQTIHSIPTQPMFRPATRAPYSNLQSTSCYVAFYPLWYKCSDSLGGYPYPARNAQGCCQKTSTAAISVHRYQYISCGHRGWRRHQLRRCLVLAIYRADRKNPQSLVEASSWNEQFAKSRNERERLSKLRTPDSELF